ncbi:YbaK/EbsC family protein [Oceanibacterium hippocampi]|uniref:Cys-tRNA(Pro)/Cys-tRNA(Cys) deacylase YbaK n=1 Tax=Oceanibacterium hippocampi TaxID=745714 RepID=A0A1Y5U4G2_9PROT|nr:YbaK/EbsC family protein [Oceanibacterium hippocampi]SLN77049.1 Cys-tRNA(Pro)/Cys-tRNA(Cys) deacylase YbaK [Oceanibacterium hippocampi]
MNEKLLEREPVRRVAAVLAAAGAGEVLTLAETARTAADAARSLDCPQGAIVKSLVFAAGEQALMALVSGDRQCDTKALRRGLGLEARVGRADADFVRQATGYTIGGVSPVGLATAMPLAIDAGLARFETIYAAAGHPHCVFAIDFAGLCRLTGGIVLDDIGSDAGK